VLLRSGTRLVGELAPAVWRVETAFGVISVPVTSIKRVVFGRYSDAERIAQVRQWIEALGSNESDLVEAARKGLTENARFAAVDLDAVSKTHDDPEVRRACLELIEQSALEPEEIVPDEDSITTDAFSPVGRIQSQTFRVTVAELPDLTIRRTDIVSVVARGAVEPARRVKMGGQYTYPNQWLDTKMRVERGQSITIRAGGSIQFPNWGGQVFTPDGNPQMGMINGMAVGCLAGRVGDSGQLFRIGSRFEGKAPAAGTLQLCMVMSVRGQPTNGEYEITIESGG
jgi:hypothetical protein